MPKQEVFKVEEIDKSNPEGDNKVKCKAKRLQEKNLPQIKVGLTSIRPISTFLFTEFKESFE